MKKLTLALSAIAAAFSASAHADITVSGSANVAYLSTAASTDAEKLAVGSIASFALSTTTDTGLGISASLALSGDYDNDGAAAVDGGKAVTFTTGGTSIKVGDVGVNDTIGSIGGVVNGPLDDTSGVSSNVATGFGASADDDGLGVSFSTAMGGATLSIDYIANTAANNYGVLNPDSGESAMGASISVPMGAYTVTVGVADNDNGSSAAGGTIAAALGGGTLTLGYSNQTIDNGDHAKLSTTGDTTSAGATYSMSMDAATTIAVGYNTNKDADSDSASKMELSIERSLGGGASVYLDMVNLSGDAATDGTALGFGTAVSF
jgi:hypothetical protein